MVKYLSILFTVLMLTVSNMFSQSFTFQNLTNEYFVKQDISVYFMSNTERAYTFKMYYTKNGFNNLLQEFEFSGTGVNVISYTPNKAYDSVFFKVYYLDYGKEWILDSPYFLFKYGVVDIVTPNINVPLNYQYSFVLNLNVENNALPLDVYFVFDDGEKLMYSFDPGTENYEKTLKIDEYTKNLKIKVMYNDTCLAETPDLIVGTEGIDRIVEALKQQLREMTRRYETAQSQYEAILLEKQILVEELRLLRIDYNRLGERLENQIATNDSLMAVIIRKDLRIEELEKLLEEQPDTVYVNVYIEELIITINDPLNDVTSVAEFNRAEIERRAIYNDDWMFYDGMRQFVVFDLQGNMVLNNTTNDRFHPMGYNLPSGIYFVYLRPTFEFHTPRLIEINYTK